jgi:HEAT repeat protein
MPEFELETQFEEISSVELDPVRRLAQLISNALKSLLIYPANNPLPKEFKRKLYHSLTEYLSEQDELNLSVGPTQLFYQGKVVYEDGEKEKGLAYVLHKDGIRELAFLRNVELDEIEGLLKVMEKCLKATDVEEDLVTLCWERDFNHIKYLIVDDLLDVEVPSAEDVPDEWDFDQLYHSEVSLDEKKVGSGAPDDPEVIRKRREEETKKLLKEVREFSAEEVASIHQLLETDSGYQSLDQFFVILNEILIAETDVSEFKHMMEAMEKILATLVGAADFESAARIVWGLNRFEALMHESPEQIHPLNRDKIQTTRRVLEKAGEEESIRAVSQVLNEKEITEFSDVKKYLFALHWNAISPMIHMFRDLKSYVARKMVCEVLAEKAKGQLELLGEGITDQRWYVVRNVVSVIGAIGSDEGVRLLKPIARHRDLRVRKEIVSSLFKIGGPQAGILLVSFLEDEDRRIRILASRGLARMREKQALSPLEAILTDDQFRDISGEEKKQMLESFATIAQGEAVPFLVKMASKRGWLKRDKHNETRIFAIGALGLIEDAEAKEALVGLSKKRNKVIREASRQALRRAEYRQIRQGESASMD